MVEPFLYTIRIANRARKDIEKLEPKVKEKLRDILENVISQNPYEGKKLIGDLAGYYSYRLTYKDRIIYSIDEKQKIIYVERARTHYGE